MRTARALAEKIRSARQRLAVALRAGTMRDHDHGESTAEQFDHAARELRVHAGDGSGAASAPGLQRALAELSPVGVLLMQRAAGNAAVVATLQRRGIVPVATAAARIRSEREARRP